MPTLPTLTPSGPPLSHSLLNPIVTFYQLLSPLQTVEALYAEWRSDGLTVWLVLNGATEADRERIYDQEWALMQVFPGLGLDVRLLDYQEADPATVADLEHVDVFLRFPVLAHA